MRRARLGLSAVVALAMGGWVAPDAASGEQVTATADATVERGERRPLGRGPRIATGRGRQTLLRFGFRRPPAGVERAVLRVYVSRASRRGVVVYRSRGRWSERRVTWRSRPRRGRRVASRRGPLRRGWLELDVTRAVRGGDVGLVVKSLARRPVVMRSRQGRPGRVRPRLRVDARPPPRPGVLAPNDSAPPQAQPNPAGPAPPAPPAPPPPPPPDRPDPATGARAELLALIGDVTQATAFRYAATDDRGIRLDGLDVAGDGQGGYVGVYHALVGDVLVLCLARSADLLTWTWERDLEVGAAQGTLARQVDGVWVAAYEKTLRDGVHLQFRRYPSLDTLLSGAPDREFTAPLTLAPTAEGTPDIVVATPAEIRVGLHYYREAQVDRQASGVLSDWSRWRVEDEPELNAAFDALGVRGNVGDRDRITFGGQRFVVHEAQLVPGDWGRWRTWLRDEASGRIVPLELRTHGGSLAFGNPAVTSVTAPSGAPALVMTAFLFHEGAAPGEAGELVFYRETGPPPDPPEPAPPEG